MLLLRLPVRKDSNAGEAPVRGLRITRRCRRFPRSRRSEPGKRPVAFPKEECHSSCWNPNRAMKDTDVRQGTLALMVLKTLDVLGPLHGYGIARRIEQISGDLLTVNQGTLYPVLLKLEQEGSIASEWGRVREQPQGALLSADTARPQAIAGGSPELGTDGGNHRTIFCRESSGPEMKRLRRLFQRLTSWSTSTRDEELLRAEFEEHIAMQTAENLRAGLSPIEARRQALLKFGSVEAIKDAYRDQRGLPFLETLSRDTRHAIRGLRRTPAFTAAVILTLALGIGANTAIFAVIDSILIRPLPYPQAEALVSVWHTAPGCPVPGRSAVLRPCTSPIARRTGPSNSSDCGAPAAPASPGLPSRNCLERSS